MAGDKFEGVYILHSGSAKSYVANAGGDEQVIGFHFPGDLLGIDGFDTQTYGYSLEFLETSSVCCIALQDLNMLLDESAEFRKRLLKAMSHVIVDEHFLLLSLGKLKSEQRMAKFLLDLSHRFGHRKLSSHIFYLSMTRSDIANYLGMAIETISRLLTKFHDLGLIDVQRRKITLLDTAGLQAYLDGNELGARWFSKSIFDLDSAVSQ